MTPTPIASLRRAVAAPLLVAVTACAGEAPTGPPVTDEDVVVSVKVTPALDSLHLGETVRLTASALNRTGGTVAAATTWSSSAPAVATVDATGLVTATGEGSAVVTASAGGRTGSAQLFVLDPRPPAAPGGLAAAPLSDQRVALTWTDGSDNEDAFVVERQTVPAVAPGPSAASGEEWSEVAVTGAGVTAFEDAGLEPATVYRYRVLARNENGDSDPTEPAEATTWAVLDLVTEALEEGTTGLAYQDTLQAAGGDGTFAWSLADGALPAGLSLSAEGVLGGTPTEVGTGTFTVAVTSGGQRVERAFALTVNERILAPEVRTTTLPAGAVGKPYAATLQARRGDGTYAWSLAAGALPPGLSLAADGTLAGTPTTAGTTSFTVRVTSAEMTGTSTLSLSVYPVLAVSSGTLPTARAGAAWEAQLTASGGDGTYVWSLDAGHPDWLSLTPQGRIAGTPPAETQVSFAVTVGSGDGQTAHATLSLAVLGVLEVTTTSLPDGEAGAAYTAGLTAKGGSGDNAWSIASGSLPAGLTLASGTGTISGTPTGVTTAAFTVRAASSDGQTATADLHLTVGPGPVSVVTSALPSGQVDTPYSATLAAAGGDGATYAWSLLSGALPAGLSLSASGVVSGAPTEGGAAFFTVQVESAGRSASRDLTISVSALPAPGYDIELVYLTPLSATHQAAFENARARWQSAIVGDVEDSGPLAACGNFHPATPGGVDDLIIYVTVDSIDGPFNTVGQAGPCYIRANGLPITGAMTFDEADLDWLASHGQLVNTILHEMGHVLGIGTTWTRLGLRSGSCTVDPIFTGTGAVAAFDAAGGTSYTLGGKVPVENGGSPGDGSNCTHWRESVLGREIMTPVLAGGSSNPLSAITIASLGDGGYVVDPVAADGYSLPAPGPSPVADGDGPVLRLGNDILPTPRYLVHPDGRIERVAPGGPIRDPER